MEQRYLDDDTVVYQAVDKRVLHAALNYLAIVVERVVSDINHSLVDVANTVAKQVNGNHGHGIALQLAFLHHVLLGVVLSGQIAAEAKRLGVYPSLLKLYEDETNRAVILLDLGGEVDAEHRNLVASHVGMLMAAHLNAYDLFLKQGRQHRLGDALVFHQELEHAVVYRIGNGIYHNRVVLSLCR